ncbi:hypothetical protein LFT44_05290 [Arthrobacter sp. FW306-05-C]|nr:MULTISPECIES: hypothetical protein [unclassified Arthrobacter]UKA67834.1 hypothetical protein LFT44_05290 [Arthrobacter sp. FW306-05-C]UKA76590.1 hypothetical protein LFT46_05920 [Arthrobacter sp. FW306-07-I]
MAWEAAENAVIVVNGLKASGPSVSIGPGEEPQCGTLIPRLGESSAA